MIAALFNKLFELIIGLVNILLSPIDMIIQTAFPSLTEVLTGVNSFFNLILQGLGYASSWTLLSPTVFQLLLLYYTFKLTVPLAISSIKLIIRWYNAIKP